MTGNAHFQNTNAPKKVKVTPRNMERGLLDNRIGSLPEGNRRLELNVSACGSPVALCCTGGQESGKPKFLQPIMFGMLMMLCEIG